MPILKTLTESKFALTVDAIEPGTAEPPLNTSIGPAVQITDLQLANNASVPHGKVRLIIGVFGPENYLGTIPTAACWMAEHYGNIKTSCKSLLGKDVHASSYV